MKTAISMIGATVGGLLLCSGVSSAQSPIVHFPMDGTPGPGEIYPAGESLESVPGRIGEALMFDGETVIAYPVDLEAHRELTVTAWVRLEAVEEAGGFIFSGGNGSYGPRLKVNPRNDQLRFHAARAGLRVRGEVPAGEWVFVAGTINLDTGQGQLHQNDTVDLSDRLETDPDRVEHSPYTHPDEPDAPPQSYIFIGAQDFNMRQSANAMAIDDVRIYDRVLSESELDALREDQAVVTYIPPGSEAILHDPDAETDTDGSRDLPPGTGPGRNPGASPVGGPEGGPQLPDGETHDRRATEAAGRRAIEEAEERAEERRRQELLDWAEDERERRAQEQAQRDSQTHRQGTEPDETSQGDSPPNGWHIDPENHVLSEVSGTRGYTVIQRELPSQAYLTHIQIIEAVNAPCRVVIRSLEPLQPPQAWAQREIDRCDDIDWTMPASVARGTIGIEEYEAGFIGFGITSLFVHRSAFNDRVKGIRVGAHRLWDSEDGSLGINQQEQHREANAGGGGPEVQCPANHVATGIVAHLDNRLVNHESEILTGLQLVCRPILPGPAPG